MLINKYHTELALIYQPTQYISRYSIIYLNAIFTDITSSYVYESLFYIITLLYNDINNNIYRNTNSDIKRKLS